MSVQFDNFTESDVSGSSGGSASFTHTSNNPGIILVGVMLDSLAESVTVVGYNANPLTKLFDNKSSTAYLWVGYFVFPVAGTFNVAVNFTGSVTSYRIGAITFSGIDESSPIGGDANNTEIGTTTSISVNPTVTGASGIVVDFLAAMACTSGNAASPQTEKMNNTGTWGGGVNHLGGISYQPHSGASVSMTWENLVGLGGASRKILYAVELLPTGFIPQITFF